jgi:putative N6-adenine-specific DNA methylase
MKPGLVFSLRETLAAAILEQVGYTGDTPLLDPMCGAGTFLAEAAMRACRIPPGWYRDFAFTRWPAPAPIRGFDQDPAACRRVEAALARCGLADAVILECRDFFDLDPAALGPVPGVVVVNPPYGKRLGSAPESRVLFGRIVDRLIRCYTGWTLALIAPPGAEHLVPPRLKAHPFRHGGLDLHLFTGTRAR